MFQMLTCFNLDCAHSIDEFQVALDTFSTHLKNRGLLSSTGPIGQRQRDTIMDTDDERDHEYFFLMLFQSRDQCDRSVEFLYGPSDDVDTPHRALQAMIVDPIFICWQDIDLSPEDQEA